MANEARIFHKSGGTITRVTAVGHETYKGVADWFYVCDVTWNDGSKSKDMHVAPWAICHGDDEASRDRVVSLGQTLNEYLISAGAWHEAKHRRDGRVVNWTPTVTQGHRAIG